MIGLKQLPYSGWQTYITVTWYGTHTSLGSGKTISLCGMRTLHCYDFRAKYSVQLPHIDICFHLHVKYFHKLQAFAILLKKTLFFNIWDKHQLISLRFFLFIVPYHWNSIVITFNEQNKPDCLFRPILLFVKASIVCHFWTCWCVSGVCVRIFGGERKTSFFLEKSANAQANSKTELQ